MDLAIRKLHPLFAAEVRGADLSRDVDLVIWDNRCTLHRATPFPSNDHKREMRRTTVVDTQGDMAAV
jgi:hypothetical protein